MQTDQERIIGYFIQEAQEHLDTIRQGLSHFPQTLTDPETLQEVFRAAHSIKGGAAMLEFGRIHQPARLLEETFRQLRDGTAMADQPLETLLVEVCNHLQTMLDQVCSGSHHPESAGLDAAMHQLECHLQQLPAPSTTPVSSSGFERSDEPVPVAGSLTEDGALRLLFGSDVPQVIEALETLFSNPDHPKTREEIRQRCWELVHVGRSFDLNHWNQLLERILSLVDDRSQPLNRLGSTIISQLRQAQTLVLAGRETDLQLLPPLVPADEWGDLFSSDYLGSPAPTSNLEDLFNTPEEGEDLWFQEQSPAVVDTGNPWDTEDQAWLEDLTLVNAAGVESLKDDFLETLLPQETSTSPVTEEALDLFLEQAAATSSPVATPELGAENLMAFGDDSLEEFLQESSLEPDVTNALDFAPSDDVLEEFLQESTSSEPSWAGNDLAAGDDLLEALLQESSAAAPAAVVEGLEQLGDMFGGAPLVPEQGEVVFSSIPASTPPLEVGSAGGLEEDLEAILAQPPAQTDDFADIEAILNTAGPKAEPSPLPQRRPSLGTQTMRVPVKQLDNLSNLVGELVVNRNSLEQNQRRLRQFLDNLISRLLQLQDVGQKMQDLYERSLLESSLLPREASPATAPSNSRGGSQGYLGDVGFEAVELDRFSEFHSVAQEMLEPIVRLREAAADIEFVVEASEQDTRQLRQISTQVQEGLNRSRMVPFAELADRLPRSVREVSIRCGKQAELVVEGRDTLIDKMILDQLHSPMDHMINNAIAHGIEDPATRVAAGKPPVGRIVVRALYQGNQAVIATSDDGAGIDVNAVKRKAIQVGLLDPAKANNISRSEAYELLFKPGFSTRTEADQLAGRGVGMDVVRTRVKEIRGDIITDSTYGKGTTFTIRLPLTLSITQALCCISDRSQIAFPMDGVEDMIDVPKEEIQVNAEGQTCVPWRDTLIPFRPLSQILRYNRQAGRSRVYGAAVDEDKIFVIVLRSSTSQVAVQVDKVIGEQEIVIKQLESPVPKPRGISGATVLGDGRVMPIVDVLELTDLMTGRDQLDTWSSAPPAVPEPSVSNSPLVLIVDDSIMVRELLKMTFSKMGYRVEQARDGLEAWEKLRQGLPCNIIFCDVEMPRMDGLELLSRLQKDETLSHLPVAMLTSRGADRHRQVAAQLGAKGYFTKPYLEEALLDGAARMLRGEILLTKASES